MERAPVRAPLIKNLEFKVGLLLTVTLLVIILFLLYTMYARGVFERARELILVAPNAEGVSVGMPLSFSGFPIGQVARMDLTDNGEVRIVVEVKEKDSRWLRTSSVFTIEKGFIGGAKIRAFTTNFDDPPLPDKAERQVYTGDAAEDVPVLIAKVKAILENVQAMTATDSSINQSLDHVREVTQRMTGDYGVLEGVLGGPEKAQRVVDALDKANKLLASLDGVSLKVDGILGKADQRVFGADGTLAKVDQSIGQLNGILADARDSLKKADAILANAQRASADVSAITTDLKGATTDLGELRTQVDDSIRKVNHLINEINKKWPFARDVEIKLP